MGVQTFPYKSYNEYPNWLAELDLLNDGSDGAYNPGSTATLTTGLYRYSSLNIPAGVTITPTGNYLVILVNGTAQIDGLLSASGKGAVGASATNTSVNTGSAGSGGSGAAGGSGAGGGTSVGGYTGGAGAIGGTTYGGTGGTPTAGDVGGFGSAVSIDNLTKYGLDKFRNVWGAGGGSGAMWSNADGAGIGAGGSGGGMILVLAKNIIGTGAIRADGIQGVAGGPSGGAGGGGGGGGGLVLAIAGSVVNTLTLSATGGAAGVGTGNGKNGGAGGDGKTIKMIR